VGVRCFLFTRSKHISSRCLYFISKLTKITSNGLRMKTQTPHPLNIEQSWRIIEYHSRVKVKKTIEISGWSHDSIIIITSTWPVYRRWWSSGSLLHKLWALNSNHVILHFRVTSSFKLQKRLALVYSITVRDSCMHNISTIIQTNSCSINKRH